MRDQVTGAVFKVTKGAPHVILKLVQKANDSMISQVCVNYNVLWMLSIRVTDRHYNNHFLYYFDIAPDIFYLYKTCLFVTGGE